MKPTVEEMLCEGLRRLRETLDEHDRRIESYIKYRKLLIIEAMDGATKGGLE